MGTNAVVRGSGMTAGRIIAARLRRVQACLRLVVASSFFCVLAASAQTPPSEEPILVLDPGGHTAIVKQVLFTTDGRELITVGQDKVIRIWDTATGETVRTLRGQIGPGHEGKLYAAALSPDGKTLAVGGYDLHIPLFDLGSGQVTRLLRGHENVISALAFSRDGSLLASGSSDKTVRLWNPTTGESLKTLHGHDNRVVGLAFSPDGCRVASASHDHIMRVWDVATGSTQFVLRGHEAGVYCVAWSPDGQIIASGSDDHTIRLWDSNTGNLRQTHSIQGDFVECLAFSPDGRWLASGQSGMTTKGCIVRLWSMPDGALAREFTKHTNTVFSVAFSPDGNHVASTGGNSNEAFIWNPVTGEVEKNLVGSGAGAYAIAFSPDGAQVAWGNINVRANRPLERTFALTAGTLGRDVTTGERWIRAVSQRGGRELTATDDRLGVIIREGASEVRFRHSTHQDTDTVRCFTFTPRGEVVVGSNFTLALYDSAGKRLREFVGHTGVVWAAAVSPDGRYLASANGDQTVKIWSLAPEAALTPRRALSASWVKYLQDKGYAQYLDDHLGLMKLRSRFAIDADLSKNADVFIDKAYPLLSIFRGSDNEWVAWTPEGYYACSPGGERIIGWQVNRGIDKAADYYPAYQFRRRFYRPDIIARLLEAGTVGEAVKLADLDRKDKTNTAVVVQKLADFAPPKIEVVSPTDGSVVTEPQANVRARLRDPNNRKITSVTLLVNGRKIEARDLVEVTASDFTRAITLTPGENIITLLAVNDAAAESLPANVRVTYRAPAAELEKPALYVLAIGVSKYQDSALTLKFAAKDATDFAAVCRTQEGKLYRKVVVKLLTDKDATRDEVMDGLDWLSKQVTQRDYAVVFVSGHGVVDNLNQYYFAPHNVDREKLKRTGVVWSDFRTTLANLPSKVVLVLDTCHSAGASGSATKGGDAYNDVLRDAATDEVGLITFASSMGRELSLENEAWNNGAFTKALVEGLQGKAANREGIVTIASLDAYISDRVKELTGGRQHPTTHRPSTIRSSLPLAAVK